MNGKDLDSILHCIKTGRVISPEYVRKAALRLMNTSVYNLVYIQDDDEDFDQNVWVSELMRFMNIKNINTGYINMAMNLTMQIRETCKINSSAVLYLSSLSLLGTDNVKPWLSLAVEDVLKEATIYDDYREWFEKDMECWERLKGKAPSVGDVLHASFDNFSTALEDRVINMDYVFAKNYIPDKIITPFSRTPMDLELNHYGRDNDHEFRVRITEMVCAWVTLLMIVAPLKICLKAE